MTLADQITSNLDFSELNNFPNIKTIFEAIEAVGGEARFVGGCVRDCILSKPINDIDIATTLLPEQVMEILKKHQVMVIPTGIKHGTVTAIIKPYHYEITTLRADVNCNGRHAEVSYTTDWKIDAARRDFTFNAFSYSPEKGFFDYFDGLNDLKAGKVCFIGDASARIQEDYLRILRFFRFYAYYGSSIPEVDSLNMCAKYAPNLSKLSGERIQAEMRKIFAAKNCVDVLNLMHQANILNHIFGLQPFNFVGLEKVIKLEQEFALEIKPLRRLAIFLSGLSDEIINSISKRLRFPNHEAKYLYTLCHPTYDIPDQIPKFELQKIIRRVGGTIAFDLLLHKWSKLELLEAKLELVRLQDILFGWEPPQFPLKGRDITLNLNYQEGKIIGELLQKAERYWENNEYQKTKDELIKYLQQQ